MRRFVLLLLVACGSDGGVRVGDGVDAETLARDDAAGDSTTVTPSDAAADAARTPCQEATLHSDLSWIEANVLGPSCALMGCHTGADAVVYLRLDPGFARENLVNATASTVAGWVRVVPGSPAESYVLVALGRGEGPPPRDGFMPLGAPPLCDDMIDAIRRWIDDGAP